MLSLWRDSLALRVTAYIVLALLVLVVAPWLYLDWKTSRDLEAELQRIRDAGEPLTLAGAAREAPPPLKNAAHYYQQALGQMTPGSDMTGPSLFEVSGHSDLIEREYTFGTVSHQTVRPAFNDPQVVRAFELLRQGAEQERCVYPVNWRERAGTVLPHYHDMRSAARCLSAKSKLLAHDGEFDEALDWSVVSLQIGEHTAQDPTLVAQLVAVAIQGIACRRAEETLNEGAPSPEVARDLMEEIRAFDMREPFRNAMLGERALGLQFFDLARQASMRELIGGIGGGGPARPSALDVLSALYGSPPGEPMLKNDEIIYLQMMREQIELLDTAGPNRRMRRAEEVENSIPWIAPISQMMVPVFARASEKRDYAIAQLDLFEIALAAEIYHAERGEWPFDLQQLQDTLSYDLPEDPFAGAAYRYRREPDGFVAWSLGKDLDDDGGHGSRDHGYDHENCDIVWRVAR